MRNGSLTSHRKGKSHGKVNGSKENCCFFKLSWKTSSSNLSSDVAPKSLFRHQHTVQFVCIPTALVIFEIGDKLCTKLRWVLKHVLTGCFNNSCQNTVSIFKSMFPDSKIAEKMELGPSKLKYFVNNGLAPYFKEFSSDDILKSKYFVVSLMKAWTLLFMNVKSIC